MELTVANQKNETLKEELSDTDQKKDVLEE